MGRTWGCLPCVAVGERPGDPSATVATVGTGALDGTLTRLDEIVASAAVSSSNLAVFPAMYRSVTRAVHGAVRRGGYFADDDSVENLTVIFADLYIAAYNGWGEGRRPAECWAIAFEAAESPRRLMILQHLLLGMNAHINLDLGLATVAAVGDDRLEPLYGDFIRVNEILFQILDRLQEGLGAVSPRMSRLDRWGLSWDETFMRLGIRSARDLAWNFAVRIQEASDPQSEIDEREREAAWLARWMVRPWSPMTVVSWAIARGETTDPAEIVAALDCVEVDLEDAERSAQETLATEPGDASSLLAVARVRRRRM